MPKRLAKPTLTLLATSILLLQSNSGFCAKKPSWNQFVAQLRKEALADHIKPAVFDEAFADIHAPSRRVLHYNRTQPEKRISFLEYRRSRIDNYRIQLGRKELKRHRDSLTQVGKKYGISPCFILSIWGLETSYGRYRGNFPVIQSLATLSYDSKRSEFFRKQLFTALHMLNDGAVSLNDFKGEWAGASGHCQFLPTSYVNYAASYTGNGKPDIWNDKHDAFASIANYLVQHGWKKNQPWAVEVKLPSNFKESYITKDLTKPVSKWSALGIKPVKGKLPNGNLEASIIHPDGGPAFMVFNNFKTIHQWNHSDYYVGSVGYLAEQICQKKL